MGTQKIDFLKKNCLPWYISAVMFCLQYFAYAVHIDMSAFLCNPKNLSRFQHNLLTSYMQIYVLTSWHH